MNIVKSVLPLLSIFSLATGQETAVETRPALPDWLPAGGDLVPVPGQQIDRIIRRVKQDRNVTIYEEEVIFIKEPAPEPVQEPAPQPEQPYVFWTDYGPPILPLHETAQIVADWHAGRAKWIAGPPDPDEALRAQLGYGRSHYIAPRPAQVRNGRIVLSE
jgi:hypothetical protein